MASQPCATTRAFSSGHTASSTLSPIIATKGVVTAAAPLSSQPRVITSSSSQQNVTLCEVPFSVGAVLPSSGLGLEGFSDNRGGGYLQSRALHSGVSVDSAAPSLLTAPNAPVSPQSVECRAIFMQHGRCWQFSVPATSCVNDAVSAATGQVLRNVVDKDGSLSEKLSVSVLPSVTDTSTVGEWSRRNLEQPPTIIIRSEDGDGTSQQPELDTLKIQQLMEEQTRLLAALQKQLNEQSAIIQNQAAFIADLQAGDREQGQQLSESIGRLETDLSGVKAQLVSLEEHVCGVGKDSARRRAK
uniref:Uncharacterized protein n=1 Tax=Noctiluca scintillans TaxID=2966 RepID=A0A7S0ZPF2_NOCSC|mmetsp:Transcript_132/g.464  ORF Transcript_132/g.464 Transcript_132/m.464 type:complete len:300 (+) Transcript_132:60-959(+)